MARPFGLAAAAYAAGLFHDLGKYSPDFQRRLNGALAPVDHSTAGARAMMGDLASGLHDRLMAELIAYAIAGHHAGLPDRKSSGSGSLEERLQRPIPALDPVWQTELGESVRDLAPPFLDALRKEDHPFSLSMIGRMIFSCLVDADFKDTEAFYARVENRTVDRDWPALKELLPGFLAAFDTHMQGLTQAQIPLNRLRSEILAHVRGKAGETPGLFTLTVPTGGGKTLASLGFALDHAQRHGHRRIIYAIPFTGAWIETGGWRPSHSRGASRPSRRGGAHFPMAGTRLRSTIAGPARRIRGTNKFSALSGFTEQSRKCMRMMVAGAGFEPAAFRL